MHSQALSSKILQRQNYIGEYNFIYFVLSHFFSNQFYLSGNIDFC